MSLFLVPIVVTILFASKSLYSSTSKAAVVNSMVLRFNPMIAI